MKRENLSGLILLFFCSASVAHAIGREGGNGGGAFICPDPSQSEFLDLYEARRQDPPLTIPTSNAPVEEQIQAALGKLKISLPIYKAVEQVYQIVRSAKVLPLPPGDELAWPSDEGNRYSKKGCAAKGIMVFYDDTDSMDQDTTSLNSLPNTDQAAAWVHETIYKFLRMTQPGYSQGSSEWARQIVGELFSNQSGNVLESNLDALSLDMSIKSPGLFEEGDDIEYELDTVGPDQMGRYDDPAYTMSLVHIDGLSYDFEPIPGTEECNSGGLDGILQDISSFFSESDQTTPCRTLSPVQGTWSGYPVLSGEDQAFISLASFYLAPYPSQWKLALRDSYGNVVSKDIRFIYDDLEGELMTQSIWIRFPGHDNDGN